MFLIKKIFLYFVSEDSLLYKFCMMDVNEYKRWVHKPIILKDNADSPIIINNGFLEIFTKTYVEIIPLLWTPLILYYVYLTSFELTFQNSVCYFISGIFSWSLFEYLLHKYLFHMDAFMPDNFQFALVHFIVHGIHHILPNDKNRLVMPPILSFSILLLMSPLFYLIPLKNAYLFAFKAGFFTGYIIYDLIHYYLHHGKPKHNSFLGKLKKYHMQHHYTHHYSKFGLSSPIWDYVFGTY
jgi:4-hydroxysphinganine ceramide fatty acyl 2-hydroxylase